MSTSLNTGAKRRGKANEAKLDALVELFLERSKMELRLAA
jgi:hypothetical protein